MKQSLDRDQVSRHVDAPPDVVYAVVSDVTRTPEHSPEVTSCTWEDGTTEAAVGARFTAVNRAANGRSWRNRPVVTAADPGRRFEVARTEPFAGTVVWRYELTPDGTGTHVVQSYEVARPIKLLGWFVIGVIFGERDRRAALRANMEQSLARLAELAEAEDASATGRA